MNRDAFGRSVALIFGEHCAASRDEAIAAGRDGRVRCRCGHEWRGDGSLMLSCSAGKGAK